MPSRRPAAVGFAVALTIAACSSPKTVQIKPSSSVQPATVKSQATASASPPDGTSGARLDGEGCLAVTQANLDLSAASNAKDARAAADVLEKYDPSQSAKDAIEHFVDTGGAQFDDPSYKKFNDALDAWVHQVCPR